MNVFKVLLISSGVFLWFGCSSDKMPVLKPVTVDTTTAVSYSAQVAPLIARNNCLSCHGPSNSGTRLHDYPSVYVTASTGILYGSVSWNGTARNMPLGGGSQLSANDIAIIKKWTDSGAPNN